VLVFLFDLALLELLKNLSVLVLGTDLHLLQVGMNSCIVPLNLAICRRILKVFRLPIVVQHF